MLLYYITDRKHFAGGEAAQRRSLLHRISDAAEAGIDYIQLREKDLSTAELERLARDAIHAVRDHSNTTRLLINSRTDVALAAGAGGVHLTSTDISASDARAIWAAALETQLAAPAYQNFTIAVSCHSIEEVRSAESHGADFAVLAPIFEKSGTTAAPLGVEILRGATGQGRQPDLRVEAGDHRVGIPVFALGGISVENAAECIRAGAAGVAGIRLFQSENFGETVSQLRELGSGNVERTPPSAILKKAKDYETKYRLRLPHFQGDDRSIFITFKTSGSFHLSSSQRDIVLQHCLFDNGKRYELFAAVVMSNHVHLLLRPLRDTAGAAFSLREILQSLKGASAHSINHKTGHKGPVWQEESFDQVIRGKVDFFDKLEYIEMNPVTAGLSKQPGEYKWSWSADRQ